MTKILLVEDNASDAAVLEAFLDEATVPVQTHHVTRLSEALTRLDEETYSAVLVDLGLPDSQGMPTAETVVAKARCAVVVLTGADNADLGARAVRAGCEDFLPKDDLTPGNLDRVLRHAGERYELGRALRRSEARMQAIIENNADGMIVVTDGTIAFANESARRLLGGAATSVGALFELPLPTGAPREIDVAQNGRLIPLELFARELIWDDAPGHVVSLRNIRDRRESEKLRLLSESLREANARLEHLATVDPLTDCLNRRGLERELGAAIAKLRRGGSQLCAALITCDDFEALSGRLGHAVGDLSLRRAAERMNMSLRGADRVGRVGNHEFLALLPSSTLVGSGQAAERVRLALASSPVLRDPEPVMLTASIVVTEVSPSCSALSELLSLTRSTFRAHSGKTNQVLMTGAGRSDVAGEPPHAELLLRVLQQGTGFRVMQQPIMNLETGEPAGYELLVRGPAGLEPPPVLFQYARENDVLMNVDLACVRSCVNAALQGGMKDDDLHINVLPSTILDTPPEELVEILSPLSDVCLELSEQQYIPSYAELESRIRTIQRAGITIAVDDVGGEQGTLESVVRLEPAVMKVDKSLVMNAGSRPAQHRVLARVKQLADVLGCQVVAEGVETVEDRATIEALQVTRAQGYLWARPEPVLT